MPWQYFDSNNLAAAGAAWNRGRHFQAALLFIKSAVGRILESDACSQNKAIMFFGLSAKCRIQESDLHEQFEIDCFCIWKKPPE